MNKVSLLMVGFILVFVHDAWGEMTITLKPAKEAVNAPVTRRPSSENSRLVKDRKTDQKALNSELKESTAQTRSAGREMRPEELKTKNKKKKRKLTRIMAGPAETVNVPDTVDWDHNRKIQEDNASDLNERANREFNIVPPQVPAD